MSSNGPIPLHHVWTYTDVDRAFWAEHLEGWLPQEIFDAHTHVNEPELRLTEPTEAMRRQYWVNEVSEPIGAADAERCYATVFPGRDFSCLAFGHPSLSFDILASNARIQEEAAKRGWYALAVTCPDWSAEFLAAQLGRDRVIGAKGYYSLIGQNRQTRDTYIEASIYDFMPHHHLEVLDDLGAWVALHVPKAERLGHPDNIREVHEIRERYPSIKLVIAHFGRCYTMEHAREALPHFAGDDGLYFDNSAVLNPEVHRFALELFGPERILYGTDNPIFYMRGRRQWKGRSYINRTSYPFHFNKDREAPEVEAGYTLYMYEALRAIKDAAFSVGLSREDLGMLFAGNAKRLIREIEGAKRGNHCA